jgi:hypothetical protein
MAHTKAKRRIPLQSVRDSDPEITQKLKLLFYLREVERQAEIHNGAVEAAIDEWRRSGELKATWRHLQAALFAAIIVNRIVCNTSPTAQGWPSATEEDSKASKKEATKIAKWRVRELRRLLALPPGKKDTPIYTVGAVRNSLEHIDERIDLALSVEGVASLADFYVSDGTFFVSPEGGGDGTVPHRAGLRALHPESGSLFFDRDQLPFLYLDLEMRKLRHNAREAQAELIAELRGRRQFGGDLNPIRIPERFTDRLSEWEKEREQLDRMMADPPNYGNIVIWAEISD